MTLKTEYDAENSALITGINNILSYSHIRGVRYDDLIVDDKKCLHDLLLKKYRSILLQQTCYQLQF